MQNFAFQTKKCLWNESSKETGNLLQIIFWWRKLKWSQRTCWMGVCHIGRGWRMTCESLMDTRLDHIVVTIWSTKAYSKAWYGWVNLTQKQLQLMATHNWLSIKSLDNTKSIIQSFTNVNKMPFNPFLRKFKSSTLMRVSTCHHMIRMMNQISLQIKQWIGRKVKFLWTGRTSVFSRLIMKVIWFRNILC